MSYEITLKYGEHWAVEWLNENGLSELPEIEDMELKTNLINIVAEAIKNEEEWDSVEAKLKNLNIHYEEADALYYYLESKALNMGHYLCWQASGFVKTVKVKDECCPDVDGTIQSLEWMGNNLMANRKCLRDFYPVLS